MPFRRRAHFLFYRTRIFQAVAITVSLVLLVRIIWGWEATIRLASVRSQIPLLPFPDDKDASAESIFADERNAAGALMQGVHALHIDESEMSYRSDGRPSFFGRGWGMRMDPGRLRPMLQANAPALQLIDKAIHLNEIRWPVTMRSVEDAGNMSSAAVSAFPLRMLLVTAADVAHQNGDEIGAMENLHRLLGVAHILDLAPDINSHVVAAGMRSEVAVSLERWDMHPRGPALAASRQFLDRLFKEQTSSTIMIARSFDYETSAYEHWATESLPGLSSWWLQPLALDAFARRLTLQQKIAPVTQARNWQQVAATTLPAPIPRNNLNVTALILSEPRLDIVDVMRMYFRAECDTHAASILLAANLYQADNNAYPAAIAQLVPKYIPAAPVDPFDGSDRPLHYRLDAHGPTVWSVGENGTDEGGAIPVFGGGPGGGAGGGTGGGFGRGYGGMGFIGFGYGRRYSQPDAVYGAAYRDGLILGRGF